MTKARKNPPELKLDKNLLTWFEADIDTSKVFKPLEDIEERVYKILSREILEAERRLTVNTINYVAKNLLVSPIPDEPGQFEIVFGDFGHRASISIKEIVSDILENWIPGDASGVCPKEIKEWASALRKAADQVESLIK